MKLRLEDFDAFFMEVHGHEPFDLQRRLVKQVVTARDWPTTIDLPTGAGKTACLDVAVFALAMSAATSKVAARRIVMVVDRRLVVDQAFTRGRRLVTALKEAANGSACQRVSNALLQLSSTKSAPLECALLRGAMPRDDNWAHTPDQPLILTSTVDQVGSRLLFRGYGVSRSMWPVHAGLLGNDCLFLLDEVHLSRPFFETVTAIGELSARLGTAQHRFSVVSLSATPGAVDETTVFRLGPKDKNGGLAARLNAPKAVTVKRTTVDGFLLAVTGSIGDLLERHRTILVVTNRVARAHSIARRLERDLEGRAHVTLLTGRMRPIDREEIVGEISSHVVSGRARTVEQTPRIVVATQCIEAGADFDFDAIVTELASIDALRQRFGRVDRLGTYERAEGVILELEEPNSDSGKVELPKDDPVYGGALVWCSKLLKALKPKKGKVDFGVAALDRALAKIDPELLVKATAPKPRAPALFPAYLDLWAQTSPRPAVEPAIPLFLHGPQSGPEDVSIVWRADLGGVDAAEAAARLEALPPTTLEAVSVPFGAAKAWLQQLTGQPIADVEGVASGGPRVADDVPARVAWAWGSDGAEQLQDIHRLRPGTTLVVSTEEGGLFRGSFDDQEESPVIDRAEEAFRRARGRAALRLELRGVIQDEQGDFQASDAPEWVKKACGELSHDSRRVELDGWTMLVSKHPVGRAESPEATTDDETSPFAGRAISLSRHSRDVERWAKQFVDALQLEPAYAAAIGFAAWLHDVGKADRRFQRLLRDGSEAALRSAQLEATEGDWLLAKSDATPYERRRARLASERSGYPKGSRHEVLSLAMCDSDAVRLAAKARGVEDFSLVLFLVASHHGWCRPFAPVIEDTSSETVVMKHGDLELQTRVAHQLHRLDSGTAERFGQLIEKYGWHQLAWFESIVRLADHRASEEEARNGPA